MTKQEFLKRCETIWHIAQEESGTEEPFRHIANIYDAMMRLEGGQVHYFAERLNAERTRTQGFSGDKVLANDELGYLGTRLLAVLIHPCQKCAEDIDAWHTRPAFCDHEKNLTP